MCLVELRVKDEELRIMKWKGLSEHSESFSFLCDALVRTLMAALFTAGLRGKEQHHVEQIKSSQVTLDTVGEHRGQRRESNMI